jgi:hypothetical protein
MSIPVKTVNSGRLGAQIGAPAKEGALSCPRPTSETRRNSENRTGIKQVKLISLRNSTDVPLEYRVNFTC